MPKHPATYTPEQLDMTHKLAMLQFSPDEIAVMSGPPATDPEGAFVRGTLEGQKIIRLALLQRAKDGDVPAATVFLKLLSK